MGTSCSTLAIAVQVTVLGTCGTLCVTVEVAPAAWPGTVLVYTTEVAVLCAGGTLCVLVEVAGTPGPAWATLVANPAEVTMRSVTSAGLPLAIERLVRGSLPALPGISGTEVAVTAWLSAGSGTPAVQVLVGNTP